MVVYSGFEAEALDSLTVIRLGEHLERLTARDLRALEVWVPFETLKAVVDTAVEIGREGREGKAVGTLIVVGDVRNVLPRARPLGFDPFKGYRRRERNVRDPRVREAIKEIAQMDGAFIVARDGTVEAACRLIDAPTTGLTVPKGLGNQALGRSSNYGCYQGPCRRRQSVQWHSPAVPGRRGHPPDRTHAPYPCDEMARYRDRADSSRAFQGRARAGQGQGGSRETGRSGAFGSAPALVNRAGRRNAISHPDPCRADSTGSSSASPLMMHYRSAATCRSSRQPRPRLAAVRTGRVADAREGLVLVAGGVGGFELCGTGLRFVMAAQGLDYAIHVVPWGHGFGRWFADLTNVAHRDLKADAACRHGPTVSPPAARRSCLSGR